MAAYLRRAMRVFFSPAECRILSALPAPEAAVIEALHEAVDARLISDERAAPQQTSLFEEAA